jgi:hypothetical protein
MITQYEVPDYLKQQLPVLTYQPQLLGLNMGIYTELQYFTDYTRLAITQHNYSVVKKCFRLADQLFKQGDTIVRAGIENIFIFSFSSFMLYDRVERVILKSFIPHSLYALYLKQVSQSGC